MRRRYFFDASGRWSGGGRAFLSNAAFAARRHPELAGSPGTDVPIIPRNVPVGGHAPRPYILAPQNAWPYSRWVPRDLSGARWLTLAAASRVSSARASAVLRISGAIPPGHRRTSPTIHNVLDPEFDRAVASMPAQTLVEARGAIVSIGSVVGYRNFDRLIDAYADYRARGGHSGLVIVGSGSSREERRLAVKASSVRGVTFHGATLTRSECLSVLASASLVVLPSLVEASPFSLLEALAVNPSVVASDIVGHRELLRGLGDDGSSLVDPLDPQALAIKLSEMESAGACDESHRLLSASSFRLEARERWAGGIATWATSLEL
jgi:glycosyltransferase involved in cell wall biosynthesis